MATKSKLFHCFFCNNDVRADSHEPHYMICHPRFRCLVVNTDSVEYARQMAYYASSDLASFLAVSFSYVPSQTYLTEELDKLLIAQKALKILIKRQKRAHTDGR